jgi:hypothetical protein
MANAQSEFRRMQVINHATFETMPTIPAVHAFEAMERNIKRPRLSLVLSLPSKGSTILMTSMGYSTRSTGIHKVVRDRT